MLGVPGAGMLAVSPMLLLSADSIRKYSGKILSRASANVRCVPSSLRALAGREV